MLDKKIYESKSLYHIYGYEALLHNVKPVLAVATTGVANRFKALITVVADTALVVVALEKL